MMLFHLEGHSSANENREKPHTNLQLPASTPNPSLRAVICSLRAEQVDLVVKLHACILEILESRPNHRLSSVRFTSVYSKVAGSIPDEVTGSFNWPNPSYRTMAPGSTQPLTEMSIRNLPGGKGRPARKADKLTAICEPIV
jgi:hypothetical protein